MSIARPRYGKIENVVSSLLKQNNCSSPPVDVEKIATANGASVLLNTFNNEISGLLLRNESSNIIAVEQSQPKTRQRFTIAHELGHLLLHEGEELHLDKQFRMNLRSRESSAAVDVEEIEANAFAAALLMPLDLLKRDLENLWFDIEDEDWVKSLASRYVVSPQAMTIRLMNLLSLGKLRR